MGEILNYYHSIYGHIPKWTQVFYNISDKALSEYTELRNIALKSGKLEKYELDYCIIAINAYKGYRDSMYMHTYSAISAGGCLNKLSAIIHLVSDLFPEKKENILMVWEKNLMALKMSVKENNKRLLTKEEELLYQASVFIGTLQYEDSLHYISEIIKHFDKEKLDELVLASLLTAGIPVMFEYTKALEKVNN